MWQYPYIITTPHSLQLRHHLSKILDKSINPNKQSKCFNDEGSMEIIEEELKQSTPVILNKAIDKDEEAPIFIS